MHETNKYEGRNRQKWDESKQNEMWRCTHAQMSSVARLHRSTVSEPFPLLHSSSPLACPRLFVCFLIPSQTTRVHMYNINTGAYIHKRKIVYISICCPSLIWYTVDEGKLSTIQCTLYSLSMASTKVLAWNLVSCLRHTISHAYNDGKWGVGFGSSSSGGDVCDDVWVCVFSVSRMGVTSHVAAVFYFKGGGEKGSGYTSCGHGSLSGWMLATGTTATKKRASAQQVQKPEANPTRVSTTSTEEQQHEYKAVQQKKKENKQTRTCGRFISSLYRLFSILSPVSRSPMFSVFSWMCGWQ